MRISRRRLRHVIREAMEDNTNSSLPIEKSQWGPYARKNGPEAQKLFSIVTAYVKEARKSAAQEADQYSRDRPERLRYWRLLDEPVLLPDLVSRLRGSGFDVLWRCLL